MSVDLTMEIDKKTPERNLWKTGILPRCAHGRSRVVATLDGGRQGRRLQCCEPDCGKVDPGVLKVADFPDAPPVDADRREAWVAKRLAAGEQAQRDARKRHAMREEARPLEEIEFWRGYTAFLKTPEWKAMRAFVLDRDRHRCTMNLPGCTQTGYEVHHLGSAAYRFHHRLGMTPAFLLTSSCRHCHEMVTICDRASRGPQAPTPQPDPNDTLLEDLPF